MHLKKNLNLVNTASLFFLLFFFNLLPVHNSSEWAAPVSEEAASPEPLHTLVRLEKGEIEGTIMLLSSRERNEKYTQKQNIQ